MSERKVEREGNPHVGSSFNDFLKETGEYDEILERSKEKDEYYAGKGCQCSAYYEGECACDADWTDPRVYELEQKLAEVKSQVQKAHYLLRQPDVSGSKRAEGMDILKAIFKPNKEAE